MPTLSIRADRLIPGDVIQYHQIVSINDSESREFELTSPEKEYIGYTMLREVPGNQQLRVLRFA